MSQETHHIEQWRPVLGYEGLYEVSDLGRVRSVEHLVVGSDGRKRVFPSKVRSLHTYKQYVYVNLYDNQRCERHLVHRLVAEAFIENPNNRDCVDHINTVRDDNRACNLKWVSHSENHKNPITAKRLKWRVRQVERISPEGEKVQYDMLTDAEKDGFSRSSVCMACQGKKEGWYKGFQWKYVNE